MNVLVNGIGTIGTTLLNLLLDHKNTLGITKVYALKNTPIVAWNTTEILLLKQKGVIICTREHPDFTPLDSIIDTIAYIFDCTSNGFGLQNKNWYNRLPHLKGASAQGSEKGFGIPYMSGINNATITNQKWVQIVSCNTHSLSCILQAISQENTDTIVNSDFVVVRRSEDLAYHKRLVCANVVSRHLDHTIGTHHAIDVKDLFATIDRDIAVQSSDITTPSQLMHTVRFSVQLKHPFNLSNIMDSFDKNPYIATTAKFDSNIIFELARRYSPYGRIFSHAIINSNNLLFDSKNNTIKGWAFIPQEGNTILSSLHAFLLQTQAQKATKAINKIQEDILFKNW